MSGIGPLHSRVTSGASATASVVTEIIGPTIKVERDRIADRSKGVTSVGHRALTRNGTA